MRRWRRCRRTLLGLYVDGARSKTMQWGEGVRLEGGKKGEGRGREGEGEEGIDDYSEDRGPMCRAEWVVDNRGEVIGLRVGGFARSEASEADREKRTWSRKLASWGGAGGCESRIGGTVVWGSVGNGDGGGR
ncbi:hypothetical protein BDP81DRAFT_417356 [Colletotrichum phormii]|uniref:Uncharacterized protein n=1 Tax=Colletotrichum phormii TaxID=359342 RepID=A0AAJ0A297_9PEZI|nr:uncharacterized protein BDP81DRAFT_417356 [Colletotrichum phormii]KAK1655101.1 hypothetical protein BDP81DRAFT_417356 [Colletotrichum phormii]